MGRYAFGVEAEGLVEKFLLERGCEILKTRYKTKYGEIDILAKSAKTLIAVEVKGRRKMEREGIVSEKQFRRIENSLKFFLSNNGEYSNFTLRVDVALVAGGSIEYIKNVWLENEEY